MSSVFWAAFPRTRENAQLHTVESVSSRVLEDETCCEDLKALVLGDVQDGGLGPKPRDRGLDFLLRRIPGLSEGDALVIWHGPIPFASPGCV